MNMIDLKPLNCVSALNSKTIHSFFAPARFHKSKNTFPTPTRLAVYPSTELSSL